MKRIFVFLAFVLLIALFLPTLHTKTAFASNVVDINFVVYDEYDDFLFERISVAVGDVYIDKYFDKYIVYMVDETSHLAKAKYIETLEKPSLTKKSLSGTSGSATNKKIGLYLTHNAESYIIGDGTDSFWGKGGVHDIASRLAYELRQKGVNIYLDETLHLPHDASAYTRSRKTASKLMENELDAIFDIHRDGASRRTYAKTTNGKEHSTIRIVVGQANPNSAQNLQFALYLLSVAEVECPWLFLDIYHAKGHYNQDLYEKALLFEMGTYTIEKSLVMETILPLASVINTTLYGTTVDETTGELTIGDTSSNNPTINESLLITTPSSNKFKNFVSAVAFLTFVTLAVWIFAKYRTKQNN